MYIFDFCWIKSREVISKVLCTSKTAIVIITPRLTWTAITLPLWFLKRALCFPPIVSAPFVSSLVIIVCAVNDCNLVSESCCWYESIRLSCSLNIKDSSFSPFFTNVFASIKFFVFLNILIFVATPFLISISAGWFAKSLKSAFVSWAMSRRPRGLNCFLIVIPSSVEKFCCFICA